MKSYSLSLLTILVTLHVTACDSDDSKKDEGASGGSAGSSVGGSSQAGGSSGLGGVTTAASTAAAGTSIASAGTSAGGASVAGAAGASQLGTAGTTQSGAAGAGQIGTAGAAGASPAATWLDAATGRTWQVDVKENVTFAEAAAYCEALALEGSVDWRLPTVDELRTIISGCAATAKNGTCGVKDNCLDSTLCRDDACGGCVAIPDGCYVVPQLAGICGFVWSSATQSNYTDNAWGVGFNGAHVSADLKLNVGSARCVR